MRSVLESGGVTRADELAMQEAVGTFRAGGQEFSPAFDPLAIAGSSVLLVILLGIAFERVLGLDRLIAQVRSFTAYSLEGETFFLLVSELAIPLTLLQLLALTPTC